MIVMIFYFFANAYRPGEGREVDQDAVYIKSQFTTIGVCSLFNEGAAVGKRLHSVFCSEVEYVFRTETQQPPTPDHQQQWQ